MITFDRVDSDEKLKRWRIFADSFDHGWDTPMTPLVTVSRGDKMFGFYTTLNYPILFPSFHPEFTKPRDFHDMIDTFTNVQCLTSMSPSYPNGVSFVGLSETMDYKRLTDKMGYEDLKYRLYRKYPHG